MKSDNFGLPLPRSSHVLLLRPLYCRHKIFDPPPYEHDVSYGRPLKSIKIDNINYCFSCSRSMFYRSRMQLPFPASLCRKILRSFHHDLRNQTDGKLCYMISKDLDKLAYSWILQMFHIFCLAKRYNYFESLLTSFWNEHHFLRNLCQY